MHTRMVGALLAVAVAATARAQQDQGGQVNQGKQNGAQREQPAPRGAQAAGGPTSDAFDRACIDMLHGRMPEGEKAIKSLRDACASLMSGRADERLDAERRRQEQARAREQLRAMAQGQQVEAGQSSAQPQQGQGVLAAFGQAASELGGGSRMKAMGMRTRGPVSYLLVTNPLGWFNGLGVNAELFGAFEDAPKFSWVVGARYAAADATNGTASTFGAEGGADFFILGRNNEGLRIGPRLDLAAGRERFQGSTSFARLGLGGEVGYNFIATNGISGLASVGVGGRVAGNDKNNSFASFVGGEFGPYAKVGIGYAW